VGFGARNFSDLERGLSEMARVVRPGGRIVVLEITTPTRPPLSTFYRVWFDRIVPVLGRLAGDEQAYSYLPSSVKRFPGPPALAATMERAGLDHLRGRHHRTARGAKTGMSVDAVVASAGPRLPDRMARVEEVLAAAAAWGEGALAEHALATISAGGKRLRPLLVFIAAGPDLADEDALVRAAASVELVHSATLVHDDVLDGAALRRGRPTVVAAAGRGMAVAVGDLLFSRAFAELVRNGRADELRVLSDASSALAFGELLQREDAWRADVGVERYLRRCELKTARLFQAACELGALEGGGPAAELGAFGRRIGLAFQLLDDVLDVSGPAERTGKARGTDLLDGTVTLPYILARERDPGIPEPGAITDAEAVCDRIAATGALDDVRAQALEMVAEAKAALPRPDRALELVADGVVDRYS
jgi:geranylgeranyl pyrophosphate synthase